MNCQILPTEAPCGMTVGRLNQSTYRQGKFKKCRNCGGPVHGYGSRADREKECKAFGKTCNECHKKDHFSSVCKSPTVSQTSALTEEGTQHAGTNNCLSFLAIQAVTPSPTQGLWTPWIPTTTSASARSSQPPTPCQTPHIVAETSRFIQYNIPTHNRFTELYKPASHLTPPEDNPSRIKKSKFQTQTAKAPQPEVLVPAQSAPLNEGESLTNLLQLAGLVEKLRLSGQGPVRTMKLPHMLHNIHEGWLLSGPRKNPSLNLSFKLHLPSYKNLGLDIPKYTRKRSNPSNSVSKLSIMDTGAQMTLDPAEILSLLG